MSGGYVAVLAEPDDALEASLLYHAHTTGADVVVATHPAPSLGQRLGNLLTRLAVPAARRVRDPWSGAFVVREGQALDGPAPLLETLRAARKVEQVEAPHAKPPGNLLAATGAVARMALADPENHRIARFALVGLTGAILNLALLALMHERFQLHDLVAVPIAIEASIVWNHFWNDRLTFHDRRRSHYAMRLLRFNTVSLIALAANFTAYATLTRAAGMHYLAAEAIAIVVAFGLNYAGNFHWTYGSDKQRFRPLARRALPWIPFAAVVASAAGFYLHDLDYVEGMTFDEHYYVVVAYQLKAGTWEDPCWIGQELDHRPLNYEHPPLAKFIIAGSVQLFAQTDATLEGCRDQGNAEYEAFEATLANEEPRVWRWPAALFGTLTVAFAGLAAGRMAGPLAAFAGALLVFSDGTVFTSSRMAILDIFAAGFLAASVFFATFVRGTWASMVALALGFACKYSVAFAGPAVLALALWSRHRAHPVSWRDAMKTAAAYAAVALATWFALYAPWLSMWMRRDGPLYAFSHLGRLTAEAFGWQTTGQQTHDYISPPAEWLVLERPTLIFYDRAVGGDESLVRYIYSIGNPALYWMAVAVFVFAWWPAVWTTIRPGGRPGDLRRWWQGLGSGGQAVAMASLLPAVVYGAFFLLARSTYAFYMTLVAPLMAIAVATAMGVAWRSRRNAWWVFPALALALSWFVHYLPVLRAEVIPVERFDAIMANWPWMRP